MDFMSVKLTEKQINNLLTFLDRVPITGLVEVEAFNEIVSILVQTLQLSQENV